MGAAGSREERSGEEGCRFFWEMRAGEGDCRGPGALLLQEDNSQGLGVQVFPGRESRGPECRGSPLSLPQVMV